MKLLYQDKARNKLFLNLGKLEIRNRYNQLVNLIGAKEFISRKSVKEVLNKNKLKIKLYRE